MRLQYPDNIRIVRLPCTGKVDVKFLLDALENGADGVAVVGCLEGECHYMTGNLRARKRVERTKAILQQIGIDPQRVEMYNLSAGQGTRFAEIVTEFAQRIIAIGPTFSKTDGSEIQQETQGVES